MLGCIREDLQKKDRKMTIRQFLSSFVDVQNSSKNLSRGRFLYSSLRRKWPEYVLEKNELTAKKGGW